ncbi:MAG: 50S ribosomal protein L21 [Planctomycetes bacterium]|nr:50S ribosomal protein L21 [Planctomycetota bacterium]
MTAVIEDRGSQYRVEVGDKILVDRHSAEVGSSFEVPVMYVSDGDKVSIGTPLVVGASAECKVIAHERGDKGIAGVFRRRKDSRKRRGFRHDLTRVEVVSIKS